MKFGPTLLCLATLAVFSFNTVALAEDSQHIKDLKTELAKSELEAELMFLPSKIELRQISNQDAASIMADATEAGLVTAEQRAAASQYAEKLVACVDGQIADEVKHNDYRFMETKSAFRAAAETVFVRCVPRHLDIASQVSAAIVKSAYLATADSM